MVINLMTHGLAMAVGAVGGAAVVLYLGYRHAQKNLKGTQRVTNEELFDMAQSLNNIDFDSLEEM